MFILSNNHILEKVVNWVEAKQFSNSFGAVAVTTNIQTSTH